MHLLAKMVGVQVDVLRVAAARLAAVGLASAAMFMMVGCSTSSAPNTATATPSFSPAGGSFNASQAVTITDATAGAVLYCTTDGTVPTTSSPQCSQPTTVFKSEYLQAIALAPGKTASTVAAAGYTIDLAAAATPTFSPAGGSSTTTQAVTVADATAGANIFYTTDGSVPTASSTLYTGPITVTQTEIISAIAIASGFNKSGVASAVYTINIVTATPVFSPAGGTYTSAQAVTISDATAGAAIYYTVDGSQPSASTSTPSSSTLYSGPVTVSASETINAIAVAPGSLSSPVVSAAYIIGGVATAPPTFTPGSGALTANQSVTISAAAGAAIYYTLNGSAPTTLSTVYSGPITVTQAETISAIAVAPGLSPSSVATASYTVRASTATPTFTPAAGTYTGQQTVTIGDTDTAASIYYTIDNTPPTAASTKYTGPITVAMTETVQAIAIDANTDTSVVATALYTIAASSSSLMGRVVSGMMPGGLPVKGSQVQLYAAGQTGYGSAGTALGASVTTDATGAFTVPYSCPASPGDLVYLVATGGDTGAGANASLELMTALGSCSALTATTKIAMNEATTVASVYALSAFITAAPNVGSSATNYVGLSNAFGTAANLVDTTTGTALTITPAYAKNPVPFLNSSTVPQARIDTLANMLNGCVNSAGTGCANLFSAATPPSVPPAAAPPAPTNSLQAAVNIAQNPGTHVAVLFSLASPSGPFQPVLAAAPGDWTMALTFTGAGLGIPPGTSGTSSSFACQTGVGPTFSAALAIDATGNVWVAASSTANAGPGLSPCQPMLAEFNNLGAPLTPATRVSADPTPVVTFGGYNPGPSAQTGLSSIAIDQSGSVWLGDAGSSILKVSSNLSGAQTPLVINDASHQTIAIDNLGNAWAGGAALSEYASGGMAVFTGVHGYDPTGGQTTPAYGALTGLVFDATPTNPLLWGADSRSGNGGNDVYQINTSTGFVANDLFAPPATPGAGNLTLVADSSGTVYGCADSSGTTLDAFTGGNLTNTYPLGNPAGAPRGCGTQLVLDGQARIFSITDNYVFNVSGPTIDEFTTAGVLLSPTNGYTGTSPGEPLTVNAGYDSNSFPVGTGAAVDGSGNLWVLNVETNGTNPTSVNPTTGSLNPESGNVLVEYVGLAAPVVTPTAVALTNGQLGVRP